jgi:hypothetical protein
MKCCEGDQITENHKVGVYNVQWKRETCIQSLVCKHWKNKPLRRPRNRGMIFLGIEWIFRLKRNEIVLSSREICMKRIFINFTLHQIKSEWSSQSVWQRMSKRGEGRNACRNLVGRPQGKRPLERSRHSRRDNIKMDLRGSGWGVMD